MDGEKLRVIGEPLGWIARPFFNLDRMIIIVFLSDVANAPPRNAMNQPLNKYSSRITQPKSQGASQAMLYATGMTPEDMDKAEVGIASVWYEGNSCNMHLLDLAAKVKEGMQAADRGLCRGGEARRLHRRQAAREFVSLNRNRPGEAARLAGIMPKIRPTVAATPNDKTIDQVETTVGISAAFAIAVAEPTPKKTPSKPPIKLIVTDSKRN